MATMNNVLCKVIKTIKPVRQLNRLQPDKYVLLLNTLLYLFIYFFTFHKLCTLLNIFYVLCFLLSVQPVDANGTKITLTGIPQIDYVWDPNLPRELNG
jgi:hypothetical protein